MSGYCCGNVGENCVATDRSGRKSARYSPLALRLKSVCNGAPGTARFLPEANTTKNPLALRLVAGKVQRAWCVGSSVSDQPFKFTLFVPVLYSSTQSGNWLSSSARVCLLSAMNSLMITWAGAEVRNSNRHAERKRENRNDFMALRFAPAGGVSAEPTR